MLLPKIYLENFNKEELEIILPFLDHKHKFYSKLPSRISFSSKFIYLMIMNHLYRNPRFMTPVVYFNDQFSNPFLNKNITELNELLYPWNIYSLTFLCAKILGELYGGFSEEVFKQIQDTMQRP